MPFEIRTRYVPFGLGSTHPLRAVWRLNIRYVPFRVLNIRYVPFGVLNLRYLPLGVRNIRYVLFGLGSKHQVRAVCGQNIGSFSFSEETLGYPIWDRNIGSFSFRVKILGTCLLQSEHGVNRQRVSIYQATKLWGMLHQRNSF